MQKWNDKPDKDFTSLKRKFILNDILRTHLQYGFVPTKIEIILLIVIQVLSKYYVTQNFFNLIY